MRISRVLTQCVCILATGLAAWLAACAPAAAPPAKPVAAPATPAASATTTSPGAAAPTSTPSLAALSPPIKVQFGGTTPNSAVLIAMGEGYFRELGLDVDTQILTPTAAVIQAVAANTVQVGATGVGLALLNLIDRGLDIQLVSGDQSAAPPGTPGPDYLCYLARPDLIDALHADPKNLRGLTVATQGYGTGSIADIYTDRLVRQAGLTLQDINPSPLAIVDVPPALANGNIDLGWSAEPSTTRLVDGGIGVRYKCLSDLYPGHQIAYLIYSSTFVRENPTAARYFMLGYLKGVRAYTDAWYGGQTDRKARLAQHLAAATTVPAEVWFNARQAWIDPNGTIRSDQIAADEQQLIELGFLAAPVNWRPTLHPEYAEWAVGVLGKR